MSPTIPPKHEIHRLKYKYIILGAGCAGLSLVWYLLEQGISDPILILDRKQEFTNDRTWCFWDVEPTPFTHLASHRWPAWAVRTADGECVCRTDTTPYVALRADDFYRAVQERIVQFPNVHLRLGVSLHNGCYEETSAGSRVTTDYGVFECEWLIDALALGSSRFPVAKAQDINFIQAFRGQFVTTEQDVFDPAQVTLMDFAVPQPAQANRFMYVLPFGRRTALIENTYLLPAEGNTLAKDALIEATDPESNRALITEYLYDRYGLKAGMWEVQAEESGIIPMTTRRFPLHVGNGMLRIGLAGGAVRPSSGYAFLRIQRQCRTLAAALAKGQMPRRGLLGRSRKHRTLDIVFLEAMRRKPSMAPTYFHRLFSHASPAAVIRFLTERDTMSDDLAVLKALPIADFVQAALYSVPLWGPRLWTNE